jgi:uncharacterized protein YdiU (UPF0061 family)
MPPVTIPVDAQFIIRLLKQALTIHYLTDGLERLGFHAEKEYSFDLVDIVFDLMGYSRNNDTEATRFFEAYAETIADLDSPKLADSQFLEKTATELYQRLSKKK